MAFEWNGATWSTLTPPTSTPEPYDYFTAVTCHTSDACTIVGWGQARQGFEGPYVPHADLFDGTTWTAQTVPTPTGGGQLTPISRLTPEACVSVGNSYPEIRSYPDLPATNPFAETTQT